MKKLSKNIKDALSVVWIVTWIIIPTTLCQMFVPYYSMVPPQEEQVKIIVVTLSSYFIGLIPVFIKMNSAINTIENRSKE